MFRLVFLISVLVCVHSFTLRALYRKSMKLSFSDSPDSPASSEAPSASKSSGNKEVTLAPINDNSIKAAGAVSGGIIGFLLAGPLGGVLLAAISNYVAKKNARTMTEKMVVKKYDPVVRKHVEFKENKIK